MSESETNLKRKPSESDEEPNTKKINIDDKLKDSFPDGEEPNKEKINIDGELKDLSADDFIDKVNHIIQKLLFILFSFLTDDNNNDTFFSA